VAANRNGVPGGETERERGRERGREGEAKEKETAEEDIRSVPAMKHPILFVFY